MGVVWITGASRGIGFATAQKFLSEGWKVVVLTRDIEKLDGLKKAYPDHLHACKVDLMNLGDVQLPNYPVDILINNAGAAWGEPLEDFSETGWDKVMDLNVKSIFFLTQKLKSLLKTNATIDDPSRVINIGSIDGLNVPAFETYSYSTSKAAVHHLTRVLANKLVKEDILVNAIAPGPYPSAMLGSAVNSDYSFIAEANPRKRVGTPEDIAGLAIFLCSRAGAYTVGETITSDGGLVKTAGHKLG